MWLLLSVVAAELVAIVAVLIVLILEVITTPPDSLGSGLALIVLAVLATGWLAAILFGIWVGRTWVRAGAIVWQVLQFAIGVGALQGAVAEPGWGWPLILVAVLGFGLLLSKPVAAWLSSRPSDEAA